MFYKIPFTADINSEFSNFVLAILVFAILSVAWWTTNIRDNWQVRAVYFLDTRLRRSRSRHSQRLTNHTVSSTLVESTQPSPDSTPTPSDSTIELSNSEHSTTEEEEEEDETKSSEEAQAGESSSIENREGPADIIKKMDADNNLVREKRLKFFTKKRETVIDQNEGNSSSQDDNQSTNPAEVGKPELSVIRPLHTGTTECSTNVETETHINTDETDTHINDESGADNIRIKLKYINDDLKIVDGQLSELLGEFKRRHFETEISENKLIKLIFNGQLLQRENDSLQSYGFFNNCVVHCLIHHQRVTNEESSEDGNTTNNSRSRNGRSNQRDWDLGNLFIILISVFLSSAWYFRYQYPQFFTITATMALVIITGLFAVISLGTFFPDPEVRTPETHIIH